MKKRKVVMSNQLFKYAGYSMSEKGVCKARFGNDMVSRIKKLTAKGNNDTWFAELPEAMTKKAASEYLLEREDIKSNFDARDALQRSSTVIVNEGAGNSANINMEANNG
jgi:hypothetical protein